MDDKGVRKTALPHVQNAWLTPIDAIFQGKSDEIAGQHLRVNEHADRLDISMSLCIEDK